MAQLSHVQRITFMAALILAGEAVFGLPFVVARVFRPTVLDVFGITNLQLGTAFSLYGVVAMLAYFPGGPLADRFSARRLMTAALLTTALGGVYYGTVPSLTGLKVLFAFWGLTTILLFWAALIRATREWGGETSQGRAFGILDGGRGLVAAVLASVTVAIFAALLPTDVASATLEQRADALQKVIWVFTGMTVVAALFVWVGVPEGMARRPLKSNSKISLQAIAGVLKNRGVWLQGVIVVCAYTGYKGTDDFGLYARDAFAFDDVRSAGVGTVSFWVRPVAALGAGMLADRISASRAVLLCFLALAAGDYVIARGFLSPSMPWMLYMAVAGTSAMVYGLRGVYFALFEEGQVPTALTGTAAGLVSVIGYTPDIFMGPLMGHLTDTYPGALGHQYVFGALTGFAAIGVVATLLFQWITSPK
jgi:sugar phosphate permease